MNGEDVDRRDTERGSSAQLLVLVGPVENSNRQGYLRLYRNSQRRSWIDVPEGRVRQRKEVPASTDLPEGGTALGIDRENLMLVAVLSGSESGTDSPAAGLFQALLGGRDDLLILGGEVAIWDDVFLGETVDIPERPPATTPPPNNLDHHPHHHHHP